MSLLLIYVTFFCGAWVLLIAGFAWSIKNVPLFHEEAKGLSDDLEHWPRISVIVPACNEAEHIEAAIQSLLEQDYPNLEIVAINDRSTDNTGKLLNQIAEHDPRMQVLHIDNLPEGWLGKVNALHQGVKRATGEWLLFSDADIYFSAGLLRRAILFVQQHQINHLAFLPRVSINSFLLGVSITTFGLFFLLAFRAALVNRPGSQIPIGVGAFNLVNVETFKRTSGFEWLRMEPVDDYGLGLMVKEAGGRTHFSFAYEDLTVPWYNSLAEMFKGLEKNMFGPGASYCWWRMLLMVILVWALLVAPVIGLVVGAITHSWPMLVSGAVPVIALIIFSLSSHQDNGMGRLHILFLPVGIVMLTLMNLWSGYRCIKNGGIDWRGTHYTLNELRAGQRVKF
jgi:glycosyltransferase involved in cell wall biosynthesis